MPAIRSYLTLPERLVRSTLGLSAGVAREVGEVALPAALRRSQLYQNLVDTTLRFFIEQVGQVEGVYARTGCAAREFPRAPDGRQRDRVDGHRRVPRVARLGAGGDGRPLRHGTAPDSGNGRRAQGAGPARRRTRASRASTSCSTVSSGPRRAWRPPSTRRRSTWRVCGRSGTRFEPTHETCSRAVCRRARPSAGCGTT